MSRLRGFVIGVVMAGMAGLLVGSWQGIDLRLADAAHAARSVPKERRKASAVKKGIPQAAPDGTAEPAPIAPVVPPSTPPSTPPAQIPMHLPEGIEADVSARSVAVTFGFTGTEVVVFGSVDNSRQPSAEAGYYDVVVVVDGVAETVISRQKSRVAGLWMNTSSLTFDRVPSYYAIASTRPLEEIADAAVLSEHGIGYQHVKFRPRVAPVPGIGDQEVATYQDAVVRLKQREGLYVREDYDVTFIGRSLFRASVELPANIPVGPLDARVYLFREGKLLGNYNSRIMLEREGLERWLHGFAMGQPLLYGLFVVAIALSAGLLASAMFRRSA